MRWYSRGAVLAVAMLLACASQAQGLKTVQVIVFPGGFNWPIWVAQEKGLFANNGLEVKLTPTPNSVFQLTNLIDGKFDLEGVRTVLQLRSKYGRPQKNLADPNLYYDPGFHNEAMRR